MNREAWIPSSEASYDSKYLVDLCRCLYFEGFNFAHPSVLSRTNVDEKITWKFTRIKDVNALGIEWNSFVRPTIIATNSEIVYLLVPFDSTESVIPISIVKALKGIFYTINTHAESQADQLVLSLLLYQVETNKINYCVYKIKFGTPLELIQ